MKQPFESARHVYEQASPLLRVTRERNRSTIEFYDYRRTRFELGVVRAF